MSLTPRVTYRVMRHEGVPRICINCLTFHWYGSVMRSGQDDTNRVRVGVTTFSCTGVTGIDSNFDVNGDLIPGSGQADED